MNSQKIKNHLEEINDLNAKFLEYSYHNSFNGDSPYPIGYGKVKPGDHSNKIFENYEKPEIKNDKEGNYYEVSPSYGIVGSIKYYVNKKSLLITHIAFEKRRVKYSEREEYSLLEKISMNNILNNTFGTAKECDDKVYKYWTTGGGSVVMYSIITDDSYIIYDNPYRPAIWPDDCSINI